MTRPPGEVSFPDRIGRTLAASLAVVMVVVLLVGATSLTLAVRIFRNNDVVVREYGHILRLGQIHSLFGELIFELHQVDAASAAARTTHALLLDEDAARQLDALAELHRGEPAEPEREQAFAELRRLVADARSLTQRMATSGRFTDADIAWLDRASHVVHTRLDELSGLHQAEISRRLESSQDLLRAIFALFLVFMAVGGALVGAASLGANRSLAAPLRRLADAATAIAQGRLDARVRVSSSNEIGQLSHSFNLMADRLQQHDLELLTAQRALEDKVRETQALYRIGTEISRLQQSDRILQSVVDRARELLRAEAVALCLSTPGSGYAARATSGPPEAFRAREAASEPAPDATPCAAIRPEYSRAQLAAPLQLGDETLGVICVSSREQRAFSASEAELLASLATQAAIAIERARLSEEVRSLAAAEERERIARDMHDGLAQALGLLHLKLHAALSQAGDAAAVARALGEMAEIADSAYEDVRSSIFELRTFVSRGLGLVPGLTEYLHDFSAQNGIAVELEVDESALASLPPAFEVQAVRIIQEALANVRKHARADRTRVRLRRDGRWARVEVEDDGVGWDPLAPPGRLHYGLQTMRERAEALGGRLEIDTSPGRGARVVATLPAGSA